MNRPGKLRRRRGFSLLELLAVMSIMAMLTTLAVTSYFSAIRGMTRRSAGKHLSNTLILARQRACMEGARVSVMVFNEIVGYDAGKEKLAPSYVVCKEVGRVSFISETTSGELMLIDEFAPLEEMFDTRAGDAEFLGSIRLYNIDLGGWSNVHPWVEKHPLTNRKSASGTGTAVYEIPAYGFGEIAVSKVPNPNRPSAPGWAVGHSYGVEVAPILSLPRGFEFEELKADPDKVVCVTFQPDGSATAKDIGIRSTQPPKTSSTVKVTADGDVTWDEKWK